MMLRNLLRNKIALISGAILLLLIVGVCFWLWFPRPDRTLEYLPSGATIVMKVEPKAFRSMSALPSSWQELVSRQLQTLPQANDILALTWGYDQIGEKESLVIAYTHDIARHDQIAATVHLPLTEQAATLHWTTSRLAFVSSDTSLSSGPSWLSKEDISAPLAINWRGDLPIEFKKNLDSNILLLTAASSSAEVKKITITPWRGGWRAAWLDSDVAITEPTAINLFFPYAFDVFGLIANDHSDDVHAAWWQTIADQQLKSLIELDSRGLEEQLGGPFLFEINDHDWLLRASSTKMRELGDRIASYIHPKVSSSRLPDGSLYNELKRSTTTPQEQTIQGLTVSYWGNVQENRLYYWQQGTSQVLTNSMSLLTEDAANEQPQIPTTVSSCLQGVEGSIVNMLWIHSGSIFNFSVPAKQQLLLVEVRQKGKSEKIACFGDL